MPDTPAAARFYELLDALPADDRGPLEEAAGAMLLEHERHVLAENGAQVLETLLGLRYQAEGCAAGGQPDARGRLADLLATVGR